MQARHTAPWLILVLGLALILKAGPVLGQEMFIYPARGQSPEQQSRDRYECHSWAVQQTGFDPTAPQMAQTPPPAPEAPQGGLFRGALGGSALGAIGGAIGGNAGEGAAIGAATGALFGGIRRAAQHDREQQAQANWAAQQQTAVVQVVRGGEERPLPPEARLQVTQTPTIAVCGAPQCDCGTATLVAKQNAICSVQASTGSCSVGSGECCVCAAANTVAVCGDTCDCSASSLLTKVSAPCSVTSSAGRCSVGSGECCVCAPN